mgnify:CR=1 FL=1
MLDDIYKDTKASMEKIIISLKEELGKVRTGRANPSVLDGIKINYYGTMTPLRQIAGIQIPESRMIVVQPWDKSTLGSIEKAIQEANIGITPQNDGVIIRLPFPQLSEETRRDSIKQAKTICEKFKVSLRNARHDEIDMVKELEKEKSITEDERKKAIDQLDKITNDYIKKIDDITKDKEKEISEI